MIIFWMMKEFYPKNMMVPFQKKFILLMIRFIVEEKFNYSTVNTDENLSKFFFQILRNSEYAEKFDFDEKIIDEVRSIWQPLTKCGKTKTVKNISFSLNLINLK